MLRILLDSTWWQLMIAAALLMVIVTILAPLLRVHVLRMPDKDGRHAAAVDGLKMMGTFMGIIVGFSLVQAVTNFRAADTLAWQEAREVEQLDRLLRRYGDARAIAVRPDLQVYVQALVEQEWPSMDVAAAASPAAGAALRKLSRGVAALEPQTPRQIELYRGLMAAIDHVSDLRSDRLGMAAKALGIEFWAGILVLLGLMVLLQALMTPTVNTFIMVAPYAAALGMVVSLTFSLDMPFRGSDVISTLPLLTALDHMRNAAP